MTYSDTFHATRLITRPMVAVLLIVFTFSLLFVTSAQAEKLAPVIDATRQPGQIGSLEQRVQVLERRLDNLGLADVLNRLSSLQQQIQQLVGNLETQAHQVDSMKKRQRDLYLDIDRRLQQVEKELANLKTAQKQGGGVSQPSVANTGVAAPSSAGPGTMDTGSLVDRQLDRGAYQRAFNLLKQGRYDLAISSFKAFLETYPHAEYADNAQYWLGEAYYVQKNYKKAIAEYQNVLDHYPKSNKRPDALLKMGFTYELMNNKSKAKLMLNKVIKNFPDSSAAQLATKRLQAMN